MTYKVFVFVGSSRETNSNTMSAVSYLLKHMTDSFSFLFDTTIYTPRSVVLHSCCGCAHCFSCGSCLLQDDMQMMRKCMLESDMIVLASPVYLHNVSGDMKTFIDRISFWTHTLELRGKASIALAVEDSNGGDIVVEYLNKVLQYMGTSVLDKMVLSTGILSTNAAYESVLRVHGNRIADKLTNHSYPISMLQEQYFSQLKKVMANNGGSTYERKCWSERGLFTSLSFREVFDSACQLMV